MIKLSATEFFWERWRAGSYYHLGLNGHEGIRTPEGKKIIKKYAFGYCNGLKVHVRPRSNSVAVMFFKDGETFWSHLFDVEFKNIFGVLDGC